MSRNESDLQTPHAAEGPEMIAAMREGVMAALVEHKRIGNPVVVWDRATGRVVQVLPEEIAMPENEPGSAGSAI